MVLKGTSFMCVEDIKAIMIQEIRKLIEDDSAKCFWRRAKADADVHGLWRPTSKGTICIFNNVTALKADLCTISARL